MKNPPVFLQLFDEESSTYTYILGDTETNEGIIIDPVLEQVDRDAKEVEKLGLKILYLFETHVHADHITGGSRLKEKLGGQFVAGKGTNLSCADILLADGESLTFGEHELKALPTPGHTDGCTSYYVGDRVFTGDALLIGGCGRTDFQQGSAKTLFSSVRDRLFNLPDETRVYPAHDYNGKFFTTIGDEKRHNPRLKLEISETEFVKIMNNLNLDKPKKIDQAVPANMRCGV